MRQEILEIGQIVNTFGVKGQLKVVPYTDDIHRFDKLNTILLEIQHELKEFTIEEVKYHKNVVLIKLKNINSIEEAEKLKGLYIQIKRENAIPLEKDTYFIIDLIGLKVVSDDGIELGSLMDIYNTGSNDIYVVKDELGKQLLLPAIKDVIKQIDMNEKKIIVHLIEGLV